MTDLKTLRQTLRRATDTLQTLNESGQHPGYEELELAVESFEAYANPENILRLLDALDEAEKALEEYAKFQNEYAWIGVNARKALSKLRGGR